MYGVLSVVAEIRLDNNACSSERTVLFHCTEFLRGYPSLVHKSTV